MLKAADAKCGRLVPRLLAWYRRNARDLPWRRTRDPYAIWVSEIMLQQTQVKTVLPYWERWMRALPTAGALARASSGKVHKLWEGLGYYSRVRNLHRAAREIVRTRGGKFPKSFEEILALPGIGRYTAGAICSIAFNQARPVLDGNVRRVLCRVFGIERDPREKATNDYLWRLAERLVVVASRAGGGCGASALNQSLMELGALVCTPRSPSCDVCPIAGHCVARRENRADRLPNLEPRARATARRFAAFIVKCDGHFLVRKRAEGGVNALLWEFPNTERMGVRESVVEAARRALGFAPRDCKPFFAVRHSITRFRILLEAYWAEGDENGKSGMPGGRWLKPNQLIKLPFPSAHRKVLLRLLSREKDPGAGSQPFVAYGTNG